MKSVRLHTKKFLRDVRGATLVEYIILVGVVAVLALAIFQAFGKKIKEKMKAQTTAIDTGVDTTSSQ